MHVWHPRAVRVVPNPMTDGGSFIGVPWRQVLHTTEAGPDYRPSTASYFGRPVWPHATVARVGGAARIVQHLPISRAARALEHPAGTVETNRARAVQVEIGWWAARIGELPDDLAAALADWLVWVAGETGSPLNGPVFVGPDAGWTLASVDARQRMSARDWLGFSGVCGHQHVPNNRHWDPGALDLRRVLHTASRPAPGQTKGRHPDMFLCHPDDRAAVYICSIGDDGKVKGLPLEDPEDRDRFLAAGIPLVEVKASTWRAWGGA